MKILNDKDIIKEEWEIKPKHIWNTVLCHKFRIGPGTAHR